MEIRANKPLFEPRRVIVPDGRKKRRKRLTPARKQQLEPSYEPQTSSEEKKARDRAWWDGKNKLRYTNSKRLSSRNIRFKKKQHRLYLSDQYKKRGKVKTCIICKTELALPHFDYYNHKKHGAARKSYCFRCRQKLNQSYYDKNKDKLRKRNEVYYEQHKEKRKQQFKIDYIRRTYGITATLDKSNAICLPNGVQIPVGERVTKRKVQS